MGHPAALLVAFLLVVLNGFFVAAEFAFVKVRGTRLEELRRAGHPGAQAVQKVVARLDQYLSATQLGVTLCSLALGWVGEPAFTELVEPLLVRVGLSVGAAATVAHTVALVIAFTIITFLHITVGELAPKMLALARAERVSIWSAGPLRAFFRVSYPGIWLLNVAAKGLLRLFRVPIVAEAAASHAHSEEELKLIVEESPSVPASARGILLKALDFHGHTARQVMVPRGTIAYLDLRRPLPANVALAREQGFTRYPLCDGDVDKVVGMIHMRDLLQLPYDADVEALRKIQRPPLFVPEAMPLGRLLREFQARRTHLAMVVDEYGGTSGLVTLEDILEELVGEIQDEFDQELPPVQQLGSGAYLVQGSVPLDEANRQLGLEIEDADNDTIGGHVVKLLGRIPTVGDRVFIGPYKVLVESMAGRRLAALRFIRHGDPTPPLPPDVLPAP
jgi:CBS domain containing-hemolysin-like protein